MDNEPNYLLTRGMHASTRWVQQSISKIIEVGAFGLVLTIGGSIYSTSSGRKTSGISFTHQSLRLDRTIGSRISERVQGTDITCFSYFINSSSRWSSKHRIWLLDVAREVSDTTQLYGFDISDSQYPHSKYLPNNVRLQVLDNLNLDPPKELQDTFDIVHLRLWLGAVPNGDPTALLTHALKLLRMLLPFGDGSAHVRIMTNYLQVQEAMSNGVRPILFVASLRAQTGNTRRMWRKFSLWCKMSKITGK